jgi:malate permease and related proteins
MAFTEGSGRLSLFAVLLLKLIPLYLLIALGFAARRLLKVEREGLSTVLLYMIVPFVFFNGAMHTPITLALLCMPLLVAVICSCLCLAFYRIGRRYWQDTTVNLLALTSGDANTGYFGLPVAMMLFDSTGVGTYLTIMLGVTIYESTLGFFVTARGHHTVGEAIGKLLRLPSLYAFALGAALHAAGMEVPDFASDFFGYMRGAYTILGMMIVGMGLAGVVVRHVDWRFIGLSFLAKFICFPAIAILLVGLDSTFLHLFDVAVYRALLLLSVMPLAANTVVFATLLGAQPEKAAASTFLSTLFALVYVPLMAALLL